MFWSKNKKNMYTPVHPSFHYIKVGCKGVFITRTCFRNAFFQTRILERLLQNSQYGQIAVRINLRCFVVINTDLHKFTLLNLISPLALIEFSLAYNVIFLTNRISAVSQ